jgi:XTP/dITP diphosphohydrolase
MEMVEMEVAHISGIGPPAQRLDQDVRHAGDAAQVHVAMGRDVADSLIGGNETEFCHNSGSFCKFEPSKIENILMHTKEEKLAQFARLLDIMDELREKCPWNAAQTMESIRPMTEEEVYELSDAIIRQSPQEISKEIGDLMYHMVFYARIAQEKGDFDIADAIAKVCEKMIFRHPHVFGGDTRPTTAKEIADTWELVKAKEKGGNKTVMSGIPDAMPAILKALSMQEKARGCGFDWEKKEDVWDKVHEELGEVEEACTEADPDHMELEFGDLLFATINAARLYGIDPEVALGRSCSKFRRRFNYLEENTLKKGVKLTDLSLAEMDAIWDEGKAKGL